MGATGESVRRLTDFGFDPSWSPDGKELVVSSIALGPTPYERSGTGELSIVTVSSGQRRRLALGRDAVQPRWSPHGDRIAFWSADRPTAQRDIWTISIAGGDPVAVTHDQAVDWNPVWAPNGRHLYFASDRSGVMNIWRVPMDESSGKVLGVPESLNLPASSYDGFSLSSDGRLAYAAVDRRSTLQRIDIDPTRATVTSAPSLLVQSPRTVRWLDWSPDDEMLAFATTSSGAGDNIYVVHADASGYRQLTDDAFRNRGPRWYPDGSRILFYSNRSGSYQAWSIRPDGSGLEQLTNTPTGVVLPTMAPTGNRIAFVPSLSDKWAIADLRASGAEHIEELSASPSAPLSNQPTSWSPDAKRITLSSATRPDLDSTIVVYDLDSKQYLDIHIRGRSAYWLPDSRRLLYVEQGKVTMLDTATHRTREVYRLLGQVTLENTGFTLSHDGRRIALVAVEEQSDLWLAGRQ